MNAPWTYFFSPAAPDRSVVSSNPTTFAAMSSVLISDGPGGHGRGLREAGVDEPGGYLRPGHVGQQLQAPLHRQVLEDQQVDGQRTQPRPDRYRGVRDAGRAGRHVGLPALAPGLVQVMLHGDGFRLGDLFLLAGPGDAKIGGAVEVRPALAGALGEPVAGHIRLGPGHRRPRRPRLLAPRARRVPPAARLAPGRPRPGVHAAGRHEELPLLRETDRPGGLLVFRSVTSAPAPRALPELRDLPSRAAHGAQPRAGGSISDTEDDHARPARSQLTDDGSA